MRPYGELCSVKTLTDLKLIKTILSKNHIEYFVNGDPFNLLLLKVRDTIQIMVKYDELRKAKQILSGSN